LEEFITNETGVLARYKWALTLEVTRKELGITRQAVRQQEAKALRKLRLSRICRELEEKFEVNYARAYRGSFREFKYTGTSIVEDIVKRILINKIGGL
jgi:hypothetical protein